MIPPNSAAGIDDASNIHSFFQSTALLRLKAQVEYVAATMLSANAVGRISDAGKEAKAIKARNAVPPAWPTVA